MATKKPKQKTKSLSKMPQCVVGHTKEKEGRKMTRTSQSEVHAYIHIFRELTEKKGWNKNQVYTQQEYKKIKFVAEGLGLKKPENVVEIDNKNYYIIEGKNEKDKLNQAVREAQEYAKLINDKGKVKSLFITGIAGNNEENFIARSQYLKNGTWETITENEIEITALLSTKQVETIQQNNEPHIKDVEITEEEFLKSAEKINEALQVNAIPKEVRGRFIATILLAMSDGQDINTSENTLVLIETINTKVRVILRRHGKEEFAKYVKIDEPLTEDNHTKYKKAIVDTHQELLGLNIRSAMNSGKDVLGKFYEVFLKYGNSMKDLGIVLTPRHITKFASEVLDVNSNDLVLDPACGTGGFLVGAFDEVKKKSTPRELDKFRINGIYGIEEQDSIVALAIVNMIFRGDGKNNMIQGNCFKKWLNTKQLNGTLFAVYTKEEPPQRIRPITKVLMNPPFSKEKDEDKEYKFIDHALDQMQENGLLFCVLPRGVMVKQKKFVNWRKESLLKKNTLLAVIDFPKDVFYPIGAETCGIIVKKGISHNDRQKVLWIKVEKDGFVKVKGRRLPNEKTPNQLKEITPLVKKFIENQDINVKNVKEFQKVTMIDSNDDTIELLPEVYLDEKKPTKKELLNSIDTILRSTIAFMFAGDKVEHFRKNVLTKELLAKPKKSNNKITWKEIPITDIFEEPDTGNYHKSKALDEGQTPLISCSTINNGAEGYFEIPKENIHSNALTIASDGSPLTSFYHYYPFTAKDNVLIAKPNKEYKFTTNLFFATQLNRLKWRFSYGRKAYKNKVPKIKIFLPYYKNKLDEKYIEYLFKTSQTWNLLEKLFK